MKCSACQTEASGAYCPTCGAPLDGATCKTCEAPLIAGAHYCTQCGDAVRERGSAVSTYATSAVLLILALALIVPRLGGGRAAADLPLQPAGGMMGTGTMGTGTPPPLTGTPREQADQLFNRVMQARAMGAVEEVRFFLPMAVAAYRQAGELDWDGLYHLSVLEAEAGELATALATAMRILEDEPDHLLALGAAARVADSLGDTAAAGRFYQRLLDAFETESAQPRPEYAEHSLILPEYRAEAEAYPR